MPLSAGLIDLRSDTVTHPTPEMRRAMAEAEVGDDVFGDDPTVIALEARAAGLLGKEAGLFVASGAMGNLVAQMAHLARGQEIIAGEESHIVMDEAAGRVQRFSADGQVLDMWGALGKAAGEFAGHSSLAPDGYVVDSRIAVGPTGVVFTSDHGAARIEKFTRSGLY